MICIIVYLCIIVVLNWFTSYIALLAAVPLNVDTRDWLADPRVEQVVSHITSGSGAIYVYISSGVCLCMYYNMSVCLRICLCIFVYVYVYGYLYVCICMFYIISHSRCVLLHYFVMRLVRSSSLSIGDRHFVTGFSIGQFRLCTGIYVTEWCIS